MSLDFAKKETAPDSGTPQRLAVAVLDVLGFSARVKQTPLAVLAAEYSQLRAAVDWSTEIPLFILNPPSAQSWRVRCAFFSDTMVIWGTADTDSLDFMLNATTRIMAASAEIGWALRGAVTVGECIIDPSNNVFLGEAIVRAVELEKCQMWVGCGIDERLANDANCGKLVRNYVDVKNYVVPVKLGAPAMNWALCWAKYDVDAVDHLLKIKTSAPSKEHAKYDRAVTFINACG